MNRSSRRRLSFAASALALALAAGCTGYRPAPAAFHEAINKPYLLDAGDQIRVTVFDQEDLSNTYAVGKSGYIAFPLVGSVPARGRTVQQLEEILASQLRNGFLRNPDVSVEIEAYRSIYIMGEVGAAGQYAYTPGMTVQNAIAAAGGFSARANQANVDITRQINGQVMTGRVLISDPLLPGDTVFVRERLF
ncbi:polysaccharide biosynthesis/export family protein [Oricola sp.]|uniref:polysaccharide biosynthesis/export family protein n=1 Tax=Oricola sp. TaxID=1979950 RepID=UPI003BA9F991